MLSCLDNRVVEVQGISDPIGPIPTEITTNGIGFLTTSIGWIGIIGPDGKLPNPQAIGQLLRTLKAVKINGMAFAIAGTTKHIAKWHVKGEPSDAAQIPTEPE